MPLFKGKKTKRAESKKKEREKNVSQKKKKEVSVSSRAYHVLKYPLVTEKGTALGALNKYVFEVFAQANKSEVKKAIEEIFNVHVRKVNIINLQGKQRRYGRSQGRTRARKKAVVTLQPGETIQIFEGV